MWQSGKPDISHMQSFGLEDEVHFGECIRSVKTEVPGREPTIRQILWEGTAVYMEQVIASPREVVDGANLLWWALTDENRGHYPSVIVARPSLPHAVNITAGHG